MAISTNESSRLMQNSVYIFLCVATARKSQTISRSFVARVQQQCLQYPTR